MLHKPPVKTGIVTAALALLAWFLLFGKADRGKLTCASWFTSEFFEAATVADVSRCLEQRYWAVFGSGELKGLLEGWANIKEGGFTPLHMAAAHSDSPDVVKALLDAGANIEVQNDQHGGTPLHIAAAHSDSPDVVKALLNAGANIEARDEDGWTPLHYAAQFSKFPDVVKVLLDAGANIDARTANADFTPADLIQRNHALKGTDAYSLLLDVNR